RKRCCFSGPSTGVKSMASMGASNSSSVAVLFCGMSAIVTYLNSLCTDDLNGLRRFVERHHEFYPYITIALAHTSGHIASGGQLDIGVGKLAQAIDTQDRDRGCAVGTQADSAG